MLFLNNINKSTFKNNNAILLDKNKFITYFDLVKNVENFSSIIKKRSLVFLICKNNFESIVGYLGFLKSDCVISLIDEKINIDALKKLINIYKPDFIFLEKQKTKKLDNFFLCFSFQNFILLEAKNKFKKILNDELALLISTSGSTGSAKLVRQSYDNLNSNTQSISRYLNITNKDISITTLPMSYVYGLSIINTHLNQGASLVINNHSVLAKEFWQSIEKNKVTSFGGVPYTYSILEKLDLRKFNLSSLKYTTQAGGKINKRIVNKILNIYDSLNIKLFLMYGAAEATARMSFLECKKKYRDKIDSIGKPIPGGKFFLKDTKSKIINKSNKSGELIYIGKNVCLGYAENIEDLSRGDENKQILKTGDIAFKDNENFYYIVGRKDRYIKIHGIRLNLQEIEKIIEDYGLENMCLQKEDNKIQILVKDDFKINEIKEYIFSKTNIHPSVFSFKKVNKFSLNNNLKLKYK